MLPPQFWYGAAMLVGAAAKKLFGGSASFGGESSYEGTLPNCTDCKWFAVPRSQAHQVRLSKRVFTCRRFILFLDQARREEPHLRHSVNKDIVFLDDICKAYPNHEIFVAQVD